MSLAAENGHTDVVDVLIKAGALVDQPDPEKGFTPLMKASRSGQMCTVQYLLSNYSESIDVNRSTSQNEHTALSLACQNSHLQVVELLLQYGANPLYALKDNSNCLIEASKGGHIKIVELLIDWNYSLNVNGNSQILSSTTYNNTNTNLKEDKVLLNKEDSINDEITDSNDPQGCLDHQNHHSHENEKQLVNGDISFECCEYDDVEVSWFLELICTYFC